MRKLTRREFVAGAAAAMGATVVWSEARPARSRTALGRAARPVRARASRPATRAPDSVLLWTRASSARQCGLGRAHGRGGGRRGVRARGRDRDARGRWRPPTTPAASWSAGSSRRAMYWYRFTNAAGEGSRIGRTRTAAAPDDAKPGPLRVRELPERLRRRAERVSPDDLRGRARAPPPSSSPSCSTWATSSTRSSSIPRTGPSGKRYDRRLRDLVRFPDGEKVAALPRARHGRRTTARSTARTCSDPDLQDARARWPFVPMWDNHEFSWMGWQSVQVVRRQRAAGADAQGGGEPGLVRVPARARAQVGGDSLERFDAPAVKDVADRPLRRARPGTASRTTSPPSAASPAYRTLRWGRHLDLMITDQHSYRSEEPSGREQASVFASHDFPELFPEEVMVVLDAGRAHAGRQSAGHHPLRRQRTSPTSARPSRRRRSWAPSRRPGSWSACVPRPRPGRSGATPCGTLDWRADPQNLPAAVAKPWPGAGYACFGGGGDYGTAYIERAEIYDTIAKAGITGFVTVSGDRHSFWAGLAAKALPPRTVRAGRSGVRHRLRLGARAWWRRSSTVSPRTTRCGPLYAGEVGGKPRATVNLLLHHGVRACLEYQRTGDLAAARRASNPELSPHLRFVDMGGHGYAVAPGRPRRGRVRVRVHPAPARAQREPRRRAAALPRRASRAALAEGRAPADRAAGDRGRPGNVALNRTAGGRCGRRRYGRTLTPRLKW